jgi:hypothetical protein
LGGLTIQFASEYEQLHVAVVILAVWLQLWEGSRYVPVFMSWLYKCVVQPTIIMITKPLPGFREAVLTTFASSYR